MEMKQFNEIFSILTEVYGKITEAKATVYYLALQDLTEKELQTGLVRLIREREFTNFPSPAEIRKFALGIKDQDIETRIHLAKEKLKNAIKKYGAYQTVAFDDPGIHAVIDSVENGWFGICSMLLEDLDKFLTFEFKKIYTAYLHVPYQVNARYLGRHDKENETEKLLIVGNKEKYIMWKDAIETKVDLLTGSSQKFKSIS